MSKSLKSNVWIALLLTSVLCPLTSVHAAQRELIETRKVEAGQSKKESHKFFQAESVQLTGTYTQNGRPVDLSGTNTVVVWEIQGWSDYTNTYAISTGTVSSASNTVTFNLPPSTANLSPSNYLGFVRALQRDGTNLTHVAVLAYQTIAVEWSPDSRFYNIVTPLTYPPLYTEADWQTITNQMAEVSGQVSAVSIRVGALEVASTNQQSAITNLQSEISSVEGRVSGVEARTNLWNSVTNKADQSDLSAVSNIAASALQAESDPAWHSGTNAIYEAIAAATDTNLAAVVATATTNIATLTSDLGSLTSAVGTNTAAITNLQSDVQGLEARSNVWNSVTNKADQSDLSAVSNVAASALQPTDATYTGAVAKASAAFGWGNHALSGYLTSAPPQTVTSVNGSTGAVVITAASIGAATGTPLYVQNFDYAAITNPPNLAVYATTGSVAAVSNIAAAAQSTANSNPTEIGNLTLRSTSGWYVSTDQAYFLIGTNKAWVFATTNPSDTNFSARSWGSSNTNGWLMIGTNTVEIRIP
jgi:hypothetical protein